MPMPLLQVHMLPKACGLEPEVSGKATMQHEPRPGSAPEVCLQQGPALN